MAFFRHLLKYAVANRDGQCLLRKQVKLCQWLMGVGAGGGVADSGEIAVMEKLVRDDRWDLVVFDVGANCGQFLNLAVGRLGDRLRAILRSNRRRPRLRPCSRPAPWHPGVVLNRLALGAAPGKAELYYDAEKSGLASLTKRDLAFRRSSSRGGRPSRTTFDAYCAERDIGHIHWLKLDVEGQRFDIHCFADVRARRLVRIKSYADLPERHGGEFAGADLLLAPKTGATDWLPPGWQIGD